MVPVALFRRVAAEGRGRFAPICLLLLLPACEVSDPGAEIARRRAAPAASAAETVDFARLQVGDTLLGLRVESVDLRADEVDGSGWTGGVSFAGRVELVGEPRPHPGEPEVTEPCFFVDDSVASRLPRFPNDHRTSWFCFTDREEAARLLPPPTGATRARIVIDRYHYLYQHTDVYNQARLVAVEPLP